MRKAKAGSTAWMAVAFTLMASAAGRAAAAIPLADDTPADTVAANGVADGTPTPVSDIVVTGRAANLIGIAGSASEGTIGKVDLDDRPIQRVGELLEAIPGLIATQHSGGGKANQYFLRGFNLDHGTDFASFIDGVPVNMRTHGHGQGYTDLNFIIPEFIASIDYSKGPYRADTGEFAVAGSGKFHTIDTATPFVTGTGSIDGDYLRLVGGGSRKLGTGDVFLGGEFRYDNGPYRIPGNLKLFNLFAKYTVPLGDGTLRASLDAYHVDFRSAEQVPERAIASGLIDRLGFIDPALGGKTTRIGATLNWTQNGDAPVTALAYAHYYKFKLISNFTYFLDNPDTGDEFEQTDSRFVAGGRVDKKFAVDLLMPVDFLVGAETRFDFIDPVVLYHTQAGRVLSTVRSDNVTEGSGAVYGEATLHPTPTIRVLLGLRADGYTFDIRSNLAANSGKSTAGIVSPKGSIAWTPFKQIELYANYGRGFHSNDARGTAIRINPGDGTPAVPVTPLVRAEGYEAGVRARPLDGLTLTATYWWLNIKSELLFLGDGGTTEALGPSKRRGYELSAFYKLGTWLTVDAEYTNSQGHLTDLPPGQDHIPNAIETVIGAGLVAKYERASLGLRVRHFGSYATIEDNSVRSNPTTVVNARLGYDFGRVELAADLINALDARDNEITYFYPSRLSGEPLEGVADRHIKPIEPRQLRLSATVRF